MGHWPMEKTDLILKALDGEPVEARCVECGVIEWVMPVDQPLDEVFLANYHCDDCDAG